VSRRRTAPIVCASAAALCFALALAGCGSSGGDGARSTRFSGATSTGANSATRLTSSAGRFCAAQIARTLGEVAGRIYHEASSGADVAEAVHRVQSSTALRAAISTSNASTARRILEALLVNQIVQIELTKAGHVFASAGAGAAIAPVRGPIPGTDARFVLSTQAAHTYTQVVRQVTGSEVLLLGDARSGGSRPRSVAGTLAAAALPNKIPSRGSIEVDGKGYEVTSLAGSAFPAGALRIALLVPSAQARCPSVGHQHVAQVALETAEQTRIETLGHVGERIYDEEAHSAYVVAVVRQIEASKTFQQAVADRDVRAIRAAIVSFFAAHIHVVRVRVYAVQPSGAQRFLYDLGGPYVLAPVHGVVRSAGKLVGRFSMAIQDDAGYVKLARRFTGADVLMRRGTTQVMGTLDPGPAHVPDRGPVEYAGRRYAAYSFSGEAFPSGPLRISLLVPSRRPVAG
jgi:hypothetical protein